MQQVPDARALKVNVAAGSEKKFGIGDVFKALGELFRSISMSFPLMRCAAYFRASYTNSESCSAPDQYTRICFAGSLRVRMDSDDL